MTWTTRPSEAIHAAVKIGFKYDETVPTNADQIQRPIMCIAGPLPFPPVAACFRSQPGEPAELASMKDQAMRTFDVASYALEAANASQVKASRDARYSDQGRHDAIKAEFIQFVGKNSVSAFIGNIETQYGIVLAALRDACTPDPLDPTDAVRASNDVELRAIVRALDGQAKRFAYLMGLALDEPDSATLAACLRSVPEACGLTKAQQDVLLVRRGLAERAADIRSAWGAACALDCASYVILHGTNRLATAAGQAFNGDHQRVQAAIESSPARAAVADLIERLIQAATSTTIIEPAPEAQGV